MAAVERRRQNRRRGKTEQALRITIAGADGSAEIPARLVDTSDSGIGVETAVPLAVGSSVRVHSPNGINGRIGAHRAHVRWCEPGANSSFQSGLQFSDDTAHESKNGHAEKTRAPEETPDFYEVLQLSPNADPETIHRVFRALAQRYHPDNRESGNEEAFKQVMAAYEVLSDPERRASFDAGRLAGNRARWRIFDQPQAAVGVEAEKRKRQGVLSLLYTKRINEPHQPHMSVHEFEDLLACPREHLEFTLWYLKDSGLVGRTDNGRYAITVKGVDHAEQSGIWRTAEAKMLPAAEPVDAR
jgi:hypothetical protein